MTYLKHVLQPGEEVRHVATVHWIVYLPGTLFALAAAGLFGYSEVTARAGAFWEVIAALFGLIGVFLLIPEWFTWWTTEIAVTNHRIILKKGFIRRQTNEMNMEKVESVRVDQSILGRMLNYGDVIIIGTGEGEEELNTVQSPIELRNHITGI